MCKPKIKKITNFLKFFLEKSVVGITLCPFGIYLKENYLNDKILINHESIHWKQQLEMLIIFFYFWYLIEWIIRILVNGKKAYVLLLFEQEAYENEKNENYLKTRKHFAWLKYIKK